MKKILRNAIRCNHCGAIIESRYRHDFVTCPCGCCSVDGGLDYLRRAFGHSMEEDFTELSETTDENIGEEDNLPHVKCLEQEFRGNGVLNNG